LFLDSCHDVWLKFSDVKSKNNCRHYQYYPVTVLDIKFYILFQRGSAQSIATSPLEANLLNNLNALRHLHGWWQGGKILVGDAPEAFYIV
jgi:hypothetical protein